ncbi:uncharacterized protein TAF1C-like isoform X2 [Prorops nasuta]|uniref:uncharacterized protein TAF1C-like isoform X2 n=1 Tax=Prorops nasuta TaxID=863751 RepID=UPI0034CE5A15
MDNRNDLESKIFKRAESHIQAKLKPTFLKTYPHYIVPGLNLNKLSSLEDETSENIMGLYQDFPFSCDLPRPLLPPAKLPRTVINGDDPATELLALKAQIKEDLDQLVDYCNKYKKIFGVLPKSTIDTKKFGKNAKIKLPRYIADIAELIEHDPDPYFAGKYNWYYTGGTLSSINIGGQPILLFPYLEELVASPIIPRSDILWKPVLSNAAKCSIESVLFEIRNSVVNNLCRIIGRHKNSLNIYRLTESKDRLSMIEIHNMRSKLPYIGADISSFNINEYCTITVERQLALWDLTKVKCINNDKTEESLDLTDAWGILNYHFLDPNVILYTDRCCLRYFDKRTTFSKSVLSMCPKQNLEQCEKISFQASSRHGSCQYIGTYHSFLMCDDRSANQCVQQKWTHQFKSAPLLASIFNRNEQEIIVTSSQLTDENSIIVNTWTGGESAHSFSLPISPPNILDTLNLCQMDGTCLDLRMRVRLGLSNVGSTLIMNNDGYVFFFIQNSIGDIFYQCITHENVISNECEENYKARYALSAWEKAFVSQNPTIVPLCMSEKYNVKHIFDKKHFRSNQ